MWKKIHLCTLLLVSASIAEGDAKTVGQISGRTQDNTEVGDLLQEQNVTDTPTDESFASSTPSATPLSATIASADIINEAFISEKPSATTQSPSNAPMNISSEPSGPVSPSEIGKSTSTTIYNGSYLYNASARGDIESVNKALASGVDVNWRALYDLYGYNKGDNTALHAAAQFNQPDIINSLLKAGADVNIQNGQGETPLYYASSHGSTDAVTKLITAGAGVDISTCFYCGGQTPLHAAAAGNHYAIVSALIDAGANINFKNYLGGLTPLYKASCFGAIDAATVLIDHGASVDIDASDQSTALHVAAGGNHAAIVSALLGAGAAINRLTYKGTPLHYASSSGSIDAATVLISHGAYVDIPASSIYRNKTALHEASESKPFHNYCSIFPLPSVDGSNYSAVVTALIEAGADVNIQENDGATPLYLASFEGNIDVVQTLIDHGADVSIPNNNGTTPVLAASTSGYLNVVEILAAADADLNIPNNSGYTALGRASAKGY